MIKRAREPARTIYVIVVKTAPDFVSAWAPAVTPAHAGHPQ